jgi:type IV pilus assembly protein PilE
MTPLAPAVRGFTLIELMVTMAVLATTAVVVYPTYLSYTRETNRGDAYAALLDLATREEHHYNTYDEYTTVIVPPGGCEAASCGLAATDVSAGGYYTISAAPGRTGNIATSFVLTATARRDQTQASDARCAVLTLDWRGETSPVECW